MPHNRVPSIKAKLSVERRWLEALVTSLCITLSF
jgi:hypothetical protein